MNGSLQRTLGLLECLAAHPEGVPLADLADGLKMPRSAAHRLLGDLCRLGYVRQVRDHGDYVLTTRLVSLALGFLSGAGVLDIAQPLLDRLAVTSGEFVRLGVVDGQRLTWVAKAQGARSGLRYDPDMGMEARLSCTASGHAWLATLPDEQAVALVARQGFGLPDQYGPNAPVTVAQLLACLAAVRQQGYSQVVETFLPGMAAMAATVMGPERIATGVISIAGPVSRFTPARMAALAPALLQVADELALATRGALLAGRSPLAGARHVVLSD